jgi:trigger factor
MEVATVEEMLGEGGKKQIMADLAIAKAVDFVVANAVEK